MRLRRLIGGLAATVGTAAVANRALSRRAGSLPPALVGTQQSYRWRGFDVSYTETGDPADPDVLLLHGVHAAASSQEFDRVVDELAEDHHVLAPDLPGFGRSDRPPVTYTAALYEAFVRDFATDLTEDAVCVATSLTAAFAVEAATEVDFARLVLVCPTSDTGPERPWLRRLFRAPLVGTSLFNLLASRPSVRWFDRHEGYYDGPDQATVDYQWRTAHQPGARFAPASFVSGLLDVDVELGSRLAALDVPVTLVWGREATMPPLAVGRALAEQADTRLVVIDGARLLPHAEHPQEFLTAVAPDLPRRAAE